MGINECRIVAHGPPVSYLISPKQLSPFQSRFVPVATLTGERGTSSRKILAEFGRCGDETLGFETFGTTTQGHLVRLSDLGFFGTVIRRLTQPARRSVQRGSPAQSVCAGDRIAPLFN
jgi:hypothetical protein